MKFLSNRILIALTATLLMSACSDDDDNHNEVVEFISEYSADLSSTSEEWQAGFADYPEEGKEDWELTATPNQSFTLSDGSSSTGYYLHSNNRSDDTKMYITHQIEGLKPSTHFDIEFSVQMATNINGECVGIGGAPHAVTVKAGLSQEAINSELVELDHYRVNLDFGNQTQSGLDGIALGNIADDSLTDCDPSSQTYNIKTLTNENMPFEVTSDEQGSLWLTLMTDSGFEGPTSIYFTGVEVNFTESEKSVDGFTDSSNFAQPQAATTAVFFDYPIGKEFEWELTAEPLSVVNNEAGEEITGYLLHSYNRSDDTGMLLYKPIKGLAANTEYQADFKVSIASNVNNQCFGIGGAPHSVAVKAGVSLEKPQAILPEDDNHYRLNVDFGNQMNGSENAALLGDIGVEELADCDPGSTVYAIKSFDSTDLNEAITFTTDEDGVVYFSVLTDSGFEGATTMLFTEAEVTFTKL